MAVDPAMDEKLRVMEKVTWSMFDTAHQTRQGVRCSVTGETNLNSSEKIALFPLEG
jgi:hypothetical protein